MTERRNERRWAEERNSLKKTVALFLAAVFFMGCEVPAEKVGIPNRFRLH
jgi:hypothetical protein